MSKYPEHLKWEKYRVEFEAIVEFIEYSGYVLTKEGEQVHTSPQDIAMKFLGIDPDKIEMERRKCWKKYICLTERVLMTDTPNSSPDRKTDMETLSSDDIMPEKTWYRVPKEATIPAGMRRLFLRSDGSYEVYISKHPYVSDGDFKIYTPYPIDTRNPLDESDKSDRIVSTLSNTLYHIEWDGLRDVWVVWEDDRRLFGHYGSLNRIEEMIGEVEF